MAMTRSPLSASISSTVMTVSYRMELPTFLVESVLVATCSRRSVVSTNHVLKCENALERECHSSFRSPSHRPCREVEASAVF